MRKERHQKLFQDKFDISEEKRSSTEIDTEISFYAKQNKIDVNEKSIKGILAALSLYEGVFYIKPSDVNRNLLRLNLEGVYQNVIKLRKGEHQDNDWAYDNDEFQKVYVLSFDGEYAIIALIYNDSFCPIIVDKIPTHDIYLEGNMAKSIREECI